MAKLSAAPAYIYHVERQLLFLILVAANLHHLVRLEGVGPRRHWLYQNIKYETESEMPQSAGGMKGSNVEEQNLKKRVTMQLEREWTLLLLIERLNHQELCQHLKSSTFVRSFNIGDFRILRWLPSFVELSLRVSNSLPVETMHNHIQICWAFEKMLLHWIFPACNSGKHLEEKSGPWIWMTNTSMDFQLLCILADQGNKTKQVKQSLAAPLQYKRPFLRTRAWNLLLCFGQYKKLTFKICLWV